MTLPTWDACESEDCPMKESRVVGTPCPSCGMGIVTWDHEAGRKVLTNEGL